MLRKIASRNLIRQIPKLPRSLVKIPSSKLMSYPENKSQKNKSNMNSKWMLAVLGVAGFVATQTSEAQAKGWFDSSVSPGLQKLNQCTSREMLKRLMVNENNKIVVESYDELTFALAILRKFGPPESGFLEPTFINSLQSSIEKYVRNYDQFEEYLKLTEFGSRERSGRFEIVKKNLPVIFDNYSKLLSLVKFMNARKADGLGLNFLASWIPNHLSKEHNQKILFSDGADAYARICELYVYDSWVGEAMISSMNEEQARKVFDSIEKVVKILKFYNFSKITDVLGKDYMQTLIKPLSVSEQDKIKEHFSYLYRCSKDSIFKDDPDCNRPRSGYRPG